jgi:hypothetical protein
MDRAKDETAVIYCLETTPCSQFGRRIPRPAFGRALLFSLGRTQYAGYDLPHKDYIQVGACHGISYPFPRPAFGRA